MTGSRQHPSRWIWWLVAALVAAAFVVAIGAGLPQRPDATQSLGTLADPAEVYNPVSAGEALPTGYRQLLGRDSILPVYAPVFAATAQVGWPVDTLVIGVAGAETAKAYPVAHLNSREMVIDSLDGIPILVSW
jgi:hypothetical protein